MSLSAGARIGPYQIICLIGAGGMGEVFRARDTTLNRDVALKVLPDSLAGSPDRLALFRREAQVLASLNHPNIAHIHGFENSGGVPALVMELVEGPTLADRLATGRIPVADVLPIARQIAEALEAAHEQNVVHRDLKPANIKVRDDGMVKILDFGIAKALESPFKAEGDPLSSPAFMSTLTLPGALLGTAAYMSPEQARGKVVDRRTDIWSFGALVYEMVTGVRLFGGDGVSETLSAVLTRQVDWTTLPPDTPLALRRLLARCLDRDLKTRLRDIGEARIEIARIATAAVTPVVGAFAWDVDGVPARSRGKHLPWIIAGASVAALAGALVLWAPWRSAAPVRLSVTFPENSPLQLGQSAPSLAFSPDGRTIVYTAAGPEGTQLWLRDLNAFAPQPIPGTAGGRLAFFSPDGKWIGFMANGNVKKVPISLGPPTVVCAFNGVGMGATWTSKDEIVFATRASSQSLWRVPSTGGTAVVVSSVAVWYPDALPDGDAVVVTTNNPAADVSTGDLAIAVVTLSDGKVTKLFDGGTYVRYSPTGHLVYLRNNAIMAAPFDAATRTAGETRAVVVDPVYMDQALVSGNFAISTAGALAYAPGDAQDFKRTLVTLSLGGAIPLVNERRAYGRPRISPDGRRLAVPEHAWRDHLWIVDIGRQSFRRLSTGHYQTESWPTWSPDGTRIAFRTAVEDQSIHLVVAPSDGGSAERDVLSGFGEVTPNTWTPDGKSLIFTESRADGNSDIMLIDVDGPPNRRPLLSTPYGELSAAMSPDGRWLAYLSNRSGRNEVYVSAYPSLSPTVQVTQTGAGAPVWTRDNRRIIYRRGPDILSVDFDRAGAVTSPPTKIAALPAVLPSDMIDTMPDGRLVGVSGAVVDSTHELRVVLNWFSELKQRVK